MLRATSGSASPIISDGMPHANSTASIPRRTSPRASAERLAVLARNGERELFAPAFERVGVAEEQARAFDDRHLRPRRERCRRAVDRPRDVVARRDLDLADSLSGRLIVNVKLHR